MKSSSRKAIIIGASSGIGRALAVTLSRQGYELGLAARREDLLRDLQKELAGPSVFQKIDLKDLEGARAVTDQLFSAMGTVDLFIVNSGINIANPSLDWSAEFETIQVNAVGFMAVTNCACHHFLKQNHGHLVGISSIAGLRGNGRSPAYSASKALMSVYLAGLRQRLKQNGIHVTDIRPGYVKTDMIRSMRGVIWASEPSKAAGQIVDAIHKKKKMVYITKRWTVIAGLFKTIPDALFDWGYEKFKNDKPEKRG